MLLYSDIQDCTVWIFQLQNKESGPSVSVYLPLPCWQEGK